MKKIISLLLGIIIICSNMNFVFAYSDYSSKIEEIEDLLEQCENKGISTDYERINYNTLVRFSSYLQEDENNGVASTELDYNYSCMDNLYNSTKSALTGYLNGASAPKEVNYPDVNSLVIEGSKLTDGTNPVFSIGYGHFEQARKDVGNFRNFGADNIAIEFGPTNLQDDIAGWAYNSVGGCNATAELSTSVKAEGNRSLKIINNSEKAPNVYIAVHRAVGVLPNTTYTLSFKHRGTNVNGLRASINGFNNLQNISVGNTWGTKSFSYSTTSDQTTAEVYFIVEDLTDELYLDSISLVKAGDQKNLLNEIGGFESDNNFASAYYVYDVLEKAERENISVSLLLSPHYFPDDLDASLYSTESGIKFNIAALETKAVIENYLRAFLPSLTKYKSLTNIILSNEAVFDTRGFSAYFTPFFRTYLENKYGNISALNAAYGKSYANFSAISMPDKNATRYNATAVCYDWLKFNDSVLADWHTWMKNIVKEYLPNTPISIKTSNIIANGSDEHKDSIKMLERGCDIELLGAISDLAGNDALDYISDRASYFEKMFLYDYQHSVLNKPIYNSETHIIADGDTRYDAKQAAHWVKSLWQGAVHGESMSSIWVWQRAYSSTSDAYKSMLTRPDVVAATGKTHLDMTRLSNELSRLQSSEVKVAILYSKPSRLYTTTYDGNLLNTYKALVTSGIKVGVVSDNSIAQLSNYDVLVVPGAEYAEEATINAIRAFAEGGKKVLYTSGSLAKNEYKKSVDTSWLSSNDATQFNLTNVATIKDGIVSYCNAVLANKVEVIDASTGNATDNVEWEYDVDSNSVIINIANLDNTNSKNIKLTYNGTQINNAFNLIDNTNEGTIIQLAPLEVKVLRYNLSDNYPLSVEFTDISANNKSGTVIVDNLGNTKIYGVLAIDFLNSNSDRLKTIAKTIYLNGDEECKFEFGTSITEDVDTISARFFDNEYLGNLVSQFTAGN